METQENKSKSWFKVSRNQLAIAIVAFGVIFRLLPLVLGNGFGNNFAPVAAIALFGGVYLDRRYSVWLPLIIMASTDIFLGLHTLIIFTWGTYALIGLLGLWLRNHKGLANTLVTAISGSLLFFFITNAAVWAFTPMYAHNLTGLLQCFTMALPFFRNTLASDIFFVTVLFGVMEFINERISKRVTATGANLA